MNTTFTDETDPALDPAAERSSGLRVVIAYEDVDSGRHAIRVIRAVASGLGEGIRVDPLPWSFGLLADADWRRVAASDAIRADALIIVSGDSSATPPGAERWAESAVRRTQGTSGAVVATFGPAGRTDGASSERLEHIRTAVERAGWEFFASLAPQELGETLDRIHRRAEMVTPLLTEILDRHIAGFSDPHVP